MFDFLPDEQRQRMLDVLAGRARAPESLVRPPEADAAPAPTDPPAASAAPADDTLGRFKAAQAQDRTTREQVARSEFMRGMLGNRIDPAKLNVNAAGDVAKEVGLKHQIAGEDREAQAFQPKLRGLQATAATEEAGVPYAGENAKNKAAELAARAAKEGQTAVSGAADLADKERFRQALLNGDSTATATARALASKFMPGMKEQFATAKGSELYPLLSAMEKAYGVDAMAAYRSAMLTHKDSNYDTKREDDLAKRMSAGLDPYAQRGGLKGSMDILNRAKRLKALVESSPNLDRRQIEEVAIGLNALLSGSNAGAQHQVEALVPQSIWGDVQKLKERITNEPTGLDQQKFVQRMLETIEREEAVTQKTVRDAVKSRLPEFAPLRDLNGTRYESILRARGLDPELFDDKGLDAGGAAPAGAAASQRKTVNGKTYEKRADGWYEVQG